MIRLPPKKKSLGQHFLHDHHVIAAIIRLINPQMDDHVVEIGSGAGALTAELLPKVSALTAIEIDQEIIPYLQDHCKHSPKLKVHLADVLKFDFSSLGSSLRLVGNLPYNISTPLLFYLLHNIEAIKDIHFMLQKEVADRIVAEPNSKTYGRLSVMIQYYFDVKIVLKIAPGSFSPPPKVNSAIVRFIPRLIRELTMAEESNFNRVVKEAFSMRRKTIANSLKKYFSAERLIELGVNPKLRAENLNSRQFITLSKQT